MKSVYTLACLRITVFCCWILCGGQICLAQSYGLGFVSHEDIADKRTALDLFPDKSLFIKSSFSLSFDLTFIPERNDYFGYIFRLIADGKTNIDLLYDVKDIDGPLLPADNQHFKLIIRGLYTGISFGIPKKKLINTWNKITLTYDTLNDSVNLTVNGQSYSQSHIGLKPNSSYKFLFGSNNYLGFKTYDNPPFKLRSVKLDVPGKKSYWWPLDEESGTEILDVKSAQKATVSNPLWMKSLHKNWERITSLETMGAASLAFNNAQNEVYIINKDSIYTYQLNSNTLSGAAYRSGHPNLYSSNESLYNNANHKLYNFFIDRNTRRVTVYDFKKKTWDNNFDYIPIVDHLHANSFFSAADTALYILGGYGQFHYKNTLYRYQLDTHQWVGVKWKGDMFAPRYLAALGSADSGKTVYVLGGYGSVSGQQTLNPQNFYDLFRLDPLKQTFKKIYELHPPQTDLVFANSMVINENDQTFTAIAFPNFKYHTYLQLITGSLSRPEYRELGNRIPYDFSDNHSFANLYYSSSTRQYIAVTMTKNALDKTKVTLYTLSAPALPITTGTTTPSQRGKGWPWFIGVAVLTGVVAIGLIKRRKVIKPVKQPAVKQPASSYLSEKGQNVILLFGDLQLYTASGEDINKDFKLLLKELFLVIFIHTIRSERGISPAKLLELFWFDKTEDSAKNNRSANLSRLKSLLQHMEYVELSKDSGNWKIEVEFDRVYVDYHRYLQLVKQKEFDREGIQLLMDITKRGNFLANAEYPWLDHIKSEISNQTINIYLNYASKISITDDAEFMIEVANCIFNVDMVNEEAMWMKCRALMHLGKHSLAKATFSTFINEYRDLYGEDFKEDFKNVFENH